MSIDFMRFAKLYILSLLLASTALATDFTRFLSNNGIQLSDERTAIDADGAEYRVGRGAPSQRFAAIGASIFTEATGLPNLPVFPALEPGSDGRPIEISLRPVAYYVPEALKSKLSAQQYAELTGHLLVSYLLGAADPATGKPSAQSILLLTSGHFANGDPEFAFHDYGSKEPLKLSDYLTTIPRGIRHMKSSDGFGFAHYLEDLVTRIELMSPEALDKTFGPAFEALNRERVSKGLFAIDYKAELERRIHNARTELLEGLKELKVPHSIISDFRPRFKKIPAPHINVPTLKLDAEPPPLLSRRFAPVDLLWGHYFSLDPRKRDASLKALAHQLGVEPGAVLAQLSERAKTDQSRIYEVLPHMEPIGASFASDDLAQTMLNPRNRKTLVVVPVNDDEAREIEKISKRAGAHVMALNVGHGSRLDDDKVKSIEAYVKGQGIERVIIVELPGETKEYEDKIRAAGSPSGEAGRGMAGVELVIVDHHDYKDLDRHHPLSSLEQTAQHLGWKLNPESKAIAVMDRSLIFGLADLGVPRENLKHYTHADPAMADREGILKIPTNKGPLYIARGFWGKIGDLVAALAERQYPTIPNLLVVYHDSLRFSGSPEIVAKLQEIVRPYESRLGMAGAHFTGGDTSRSMFWGLKDCPPEIMAEVSRKVVSLIQNELARPPASGEDTDPHYPPTPPPPGYKYPLFLMGIPTRDLSEISSLPKKDKIRAIESIRWEWLTPPERKAVMAVAAKVTDPDEMSAMAPLAREAGDEKGFDEFLKRYYDAVPWARFGNENASGWQYAAETEPSRPKGPPPGSGLAEKLAEMRDDLARAAALPTSDKYLSLLDSYLKKDVKTAWDFVELVKCPARVRTFTLEHDIDKWILSHLDKFLKLEPDAAQVKQVAESAISAAFRRPEAIRRGFGTIRTAADYLTLMRSRRNHHYESITETEEMDGLLVKSIPAFLSKSPSPAQISEAIAQFCGNEYNYISALLRAAKTPEEFIRIALAKVEWSKPIFGSGVEGVVMRELPHFFSLKPSVEEQRQLGWRFVKSNRLKAKYLAQLLDHAQEPWQFIALAARDQNRSWKAEEERRTEVIASRMKRFFTLKPTTDEVVRLITTASVNERIAVDIVKLSLQASKNKQEILELAALRNLFSSHDGHYFFAKALESYRWKFLRMKPGPDELDLFNQYTDLKNVPAPAVGYRCLEWVRDLWKGL